MDKKRLQRLPAEIGRAEIGRQISLNNLQHWLDNNMTYDINLVQLSTGQ